MKREEIIEHFRKLSREAAAEAEECEGDYGISGGPEDGARDAFDHAATFLEQHIPPNSITLQLPTYAPGDPKAGEVVEVGDTFFALDEDEFAWIGEKCTGYVRIRKHWWPTFEDINHQPVVGRFYSTPAARDAAMKAAEEAASND